MYNYYSDLKKQKDNESQTKFNLKEQHMKEKRQSIEIIFYFKKRKFLPYLKNTKIVSKISFSKWQRPL